MYYPCFFLHTSAQKKSAIISGQVIDENENPMPQVSVIILGKIKGTMTNDSGYFKINVPAEKGFALIFTYTGYKEIRKTFDLMSEGEEDNVIIRLEKNNKILDTVTVNGSKDRDRREVGLTKINPVKIIRLLISDPSDALSSLHSGVCYL